MHADSRHWAAAVELPEREGEDQHVGEPHLPGGPEQEPVLLAHPPRIGEHQRYEQDQLQSGHDVARSDQQPVGQRGVKHDRDNDRNRRRQSRLTRACLPYAFGVHALFTGYAPRA